MKGSRCKYFAQWVNLGMTSCTHIKNFVPLGQSENDEPRVDLSKCGEDCPFYEEWEDGSVVTTSSYNGEKKIEIKGGNTNWKNGN